jgi:hypothetical protein
MGGDKRLTVAEADGEKLQDSTDPDVPDIEDLRGF